MKKGNSCSKKEHSKFKNSLGPDVWCNGVPINRTGFIYKSSILGFNNGELDKHSMEKNSFQIDKKEIELKAYNFLRDKIIREHGSEIVFRKLLEFSESSTRDYIENSNLVCTKTEDFMKTDNLNQMNLDGVVVKEFIVRDDVGDKYFLNVLKNRERYGYSHILYILRCNLKPYKDLPYVGHAENIKKRLQNHILNAIGPHGKNHSYVNIVPLHRAIITTFEIKESLELIQAKINNMVFNRVVITDRNDLYDWLSSHSKLPEYQLLLEFLINEILLKYFNLLEKELHKSENSIKAREHYYTKNYIHCVNNKNIIGTIWPNGLNAVAGGSGGSYIDVPLFDVLALCSLAIKEKNIAKLISKIYKRTINADVISIRISTSEFKNFEGMQKAVLKPVIENFIKDDLDFQFEDDICRAVRMPPRTLHQKIKSWFKGASFLFLKLLARQGKIDWINIGKYIEEEQELMKGFPLKQWRVWAIEEISTEKIGKRVGVSYRTIQDIFKNISKQLAGQNNLGLRQIRKILRKETAIILMGQGNEPRDIMKENFKMEPHESNHRRLFENIFDIPYDKIIEIYYNSL